MATLRDALRTYLESDTTGTPVLPGTPLMSILTGGVKDASVLPQEAGIEDVPHVGPLITPFALIRWRGANVTEIIRLSERRFVEIYLYQHKGYDIIEQARLRLKALLHRKRVAATDVDAMMFHYVMPSGELTADEYGGASCQFVRFYVDYLTT